MPQRREALLAATAERSMAAMTLESVSARKPKGPRQKKSPVKSREKAGLMKESGFYEKCEEY